MGAPRSLSKLIYKKRDDLEIPIRRANASGLPVALRLINPSILAILRNKSVFSLNKGSSLIAHTFFIMIWKEGGNEYVLVAGSGRENAIHHLHRA